MNARWHPNLLRSAPARIALGTSSIVFAALSGYSAEPVDPDSEMVSAEKGKEAYAMYCLACHGAEDAGIDSPSNLFDTNWYHGGTESEVETTIRQGIMEKGMPGWGQMISDQEIKSVIAYLFTFQKDESTTNE